MAKDQLTRRGFLSKLTTWAQNSLLAIVPLALLGRSKSSHFQEVAPEKTNSYDLLAKKGCSCECKRQSVSAGASARAANADVPSHVVGCDCGGGPKNKEWIAAANSAYKKSN